MLSVETRVDIDPVADTTEFHVDFEAFQSLKGAEKARRGEVRLKVVK